MRLAALLLAASLTALAGCATEKDVTDAQRLLDQARQGLAQASGNGTAAQAVAFTMNVTAARIEPGRCTDGSTAFGEECHVLTVVLDLRSAKRDLDLWHGWRGITQDGLGFANTPRGGESAAAGRIVTAQMRFDMDAGTAERFVELQHTDDWADRVTAAGVPAY